MEAEEFCLKWNNHHPVLVGVLEKLLENESMCDVTLAADHQFVKVHRLVLCACSNYFEAMLSKQIDKQAFIFLKDVKFVDLKALVHYMYKGEVNVAQEQLASFLQTAEALDIKGLAYKEDVCNLATKLRVGAKQAAKRPSEPLPTSAMPSTSTQDVVTNSPKGLPAAKKAMTILPSESPTPSHLDTDSNGPNSLLELKMESHMDSYNIEDNDNNQPEWESRDGEDDWSRSDVGLTLNPTNSETCPLTLNAPLELVSADETAGPSRLTKTNNSSSATTSRGASPVVMDCTQDTVQAIATAISAMSTPSTVCPRCSARFSRVGAMLVHLRSNECGSLPKFTCPLPSCNFTTRHQRNIKRHVVRLHPELDYH